MSELEALPRSAKSQRALEPEKSGAAELVGVVDQVRAVGDQEFLVEFKWSSAF